MAFGPSMTIAREEIFGPVLSTITFKTVDEAIEIANDVIYGLVAAVWTRDVTVAIARQRHCVPVLCSSTVMTRTTSQCHSRVQAVRSRPRQVAARAREVHRAEATWLDLS